MTQQYIQKQYRDALDRVDMIFDNPIPYSPTHEFAIINGVRIIYDDIKMLHHLLRKAVDDPEKTTDTRPETCRDRLEDEGKPHPKSTCNVLGCRPIGGTKVCQPITPKPATQWSNPIVVIGEVPDGPLTSNDVNVQTYVSHEHPWFDCPRSEIIDGTPEAPRLYRYELPPLKTPAFVMRFDGDGIITYYCNHDGDDWLSKCHRIAKQEHEIMRIYDENGELVETKRYDK